MTRDDFYLVGSKKDWADKGEGILLYVSESDNPLERLRRMNGKRVRVTGIFSEGTGGTDAQGGSVVWIVNTACADGTIDANSVELAPEPPLKIGLRHRR